MVSFRKHISDDDVPLCLWMFTGQQLAEYWDFLADRINRSIEKNESESRASPDAARS